MNLWDFKRFRLNDPALAYVYKSQGTLAKLVSTAGQEIHGEMLEKWELSSSGEEGSWGGGGGTEGMAASASDRAGV